MTMKKIFLLIAASVSYIHADDTWGMISVPVADMLIHPAAHYIPHLPARAVYLNLPLSSSIQEMTLVPRAHQALFGEKFKIVEITEEEVCCEFANLVYGIDEVTGHFKNRFWTLKSNILLINNMHEQQELVPDVSHETIILIRPTQETITQEHFSIGTQFVRRTPRDTDDVYGIQFVTQECPVYSSIAKTNAIPFKVRTAAQGRTLFVAFINSLINDADNAHGVIPFTCGGSSLQHYYANVPALSHDIVVPDPKTKENVTVKLWNRIEQYKPASGLDAAEFILRACSLCGIPFPFKTTSMMRKFLKPITHEDLEDGDFFWTPGGLVTISSLNDNQIVAASGYTYGHGQIIRCKLNELFKGVENFAQLLRAYHERQPLEILDKSGAVYKKITEYALLKFNSIDQAIEEFRKQRNSNSNAN